MSISLHFPMNSCSFHFFSNTQVEWMMFVFLKFFFFNNIQCLQSMNLTSSFYETQTFPQNMIFVVLSERLWQLSEDGPWHLVQMLTSLTG